MVVNLVHYGKLFNPYIYVLFGETVDSKPEIIGYEKNGRIVKLDKKQFNTFGVPKDKKNVDRVRLLAFRSKYALGDLTIPNQLMSCKNSDVFIPKKCKSCNEDSCTWCYNVYSDDYEYLVENVG